MLVVSVFIFFQLYSVYTQSAITKSLLKKVTLISLWSLQFLWRDQGDFAVFRCTTALQHRG